MVVVGEVVGGVYPAVSVEFPAEFADQVCWVVWVVRCDEGICLGSG